MRYFFAIRFTMAPTRCEGNTRMHNLKNTNTLLCVLWMCGGVMAAKADSKNMPIAPLPPVEQDAHPPAATEPINSVWAMPGNVITIKPAATAPATMPAMTITPAEVKVNVNFPQQIAHAREELQHHPDSPEALADLAFLLIAQPSSTAENIQEATTLTEKACRISKFKERRYIELLGQVYAVAGKFDRAIKVGQIVRMLAENAHDAEALSAAEIRLEVYRSMQIQQQAAIAATQPQTLPATQPK